MSPGNIIAAAVLGTTLLGGAGIGIWEVSKMESRLAALESDEVWRKSVKAQLALFSRRWAEHFGLWGDARERRIAELAEEDN